MIAVISASLHTSKAAASASASPPADGCTKQRQGRAGQGRAGQGRAGQGRAGQGRAGQGRAGQGRAGQGKVPCREAGNKEQDSNREDKVQTRFVAHTRLPGHHGSRIV
jgi:uncharacterized low-complexity protein